jgi:hypothetical protein
MALPELQMLDIQRSGLSELPELAQLQACMLRHKQPTRD